MRSSVFAYCNVGRQILTLKCTKFDLLGLLQRSPGPLAVIKGPIIKGREREKASDVENERERKGGRFASSYWGVWSQQWREKGGRARTGARVGRPRTSFSTLSIAYSFAFQNMSAIFLLLPSLYIAQVFRATTFGKSPRRVTFVQVFFLASGQDRRQTRRCYFWQAANTGV